MPSNHLILCHPLLLTPSILPSIRVFSNESVLCVRCPKYWSFSFSISPSNEHPGLISFRMDWLDLAGHTLGNCPAGVIGQSLEIFLSVVSSVAQSCLTLCNPMDCSTPGFPVHYQLPELAQTHVHRVSDAVQTSHSLSSPSPAFNLSQHQGLFQ